MDYSDEAFPEFYKIEGILWEFDFLSGYLRTIFPSQIITDFYFSTNKIDLCWDDSFWILIMAGEVLIG